MHFRVLWIIVALVTLALLAGAVAGLGSKTDALVLAPLFLVLGLDAVLGIAQVVAARGLKPAPTGSEGPRLDILIPGRDEASVLRATLEAVLPQVRSGDRLLVIADGCTDTTVALCRELGVAVLDKAGSGKADSLNQALRTTDRPVVVTLDADTVVAPGALAAVRAAFQAEPDLAVAGGVLTPTTSMGGVLGAWLGWQQRAEYRRSFVARSAWQRWRCLLLVSGAFAAYARADLEAVGGFDGASMTEDYEITHRLWAWRHRQGRPWRAVIVPEARATTDAPATLARFMAQRQRWFGGFLGVMSRYGTWLVRPGSGTVGWVLLPIKLIDTVLPVLGLGGWSLLLVGLCSGWIPPMVILLVMLVKVLLDLGLALAMSACPTARGVKSGAAAWATVVEPLAFLPLRHLAAVAGWWAFLRRRIAWSPQRAMFAALLVGSTVLEGADLAAAVAARRAGDLDRAELLVAKLRSLMPADGDALVEEALLHGLRGRLPEALKTWEAVVAQHPGRADGWIGLARVRWWTDDLPGARAALAEASTRAPADDEIRTLAERLIEPPVWRLDVGYAWTSSTVTRPLERTAQIHVARRLGPHLALGAGYERWTRALGEDHRGLVDAGGAIGSWGWTLAASLAPGAQAAPRSTQTLGMTTGSWNRLHAAVEAVHARYQRQDSWQVAPGVGVVPVDGWLLEAQARLAWLDGAPAWSRSVRLAWSDQPLQPFLATAWGREPDPERADRRFHAWWGGLTIPYGTFWAVTCTAGLISSPDEPDRRTASSGVIWRF